MSNSEGSALRYPYSAIVDDDEPITLLALARHQWITASVYEAIRFLKTCTVFCALAPGQMQVGMHQPPSRPGRHLL